MTENAIKQALLPDELREKTLADLEVGDSAWTVPWAMWVDNSNRCWLHPDCSASVYGGGTLQMLVARRAHGYSVGLLPDCSHKWTPSDVPGYADSATAIWIPVVEFLVHREVRS